MSPRPVSPRGIVGARFVSGVDALRTRDSVKPAQSNERLGASAAGAVGLEWLTRQGHLKLLSTPMTPQSSGCDNECPRA